MCVSEGEDLENTENSSQVSEVRNFVKSGSFVAYVIPKIISKKGEDSIFGKADPMFDPRAGHEIGKISDNVSLNIIMKSIVQSKHYQPLPPKPIWFEILFLNLEKGTFLKRELILHNNEYSLVFDAKEGGYFCLNLNDEFGKMLSDNLLKTKD